MVILDYTCVCTNTNFVNITTVDNEIVATEKQIGDEKKEIPEPIIKESFSIPSGKKEL